MGGEVSTFNNVLTHGLQSLWLKRLLSGQFSLPSRGRMERAVELERLLSGRPGYGSLVPGDALVFFGDLVHEAFL